MSKDPAFLFYTSDFLTGTMTMNNEQVGKYIRLLCLQHQKGILSEKDMLFICQSYDEDIFSKFIKTDQGFYNERLRVEAEKRVKYSQSRADNRSNLNKKQTKKHMKKICKTYDEHMENENENNNNKYKVPSIEEITAYCTQRKNKIDPQYFLDYQIARDWKLKGGQKIKDWKAVIRTWEKNDFDKAVPAARVIKDDFTWCKKCGARRLKSDVDENGICSGRCENATAAL
jgi:hypothetical protein